MVEELFSQLQRLVSSELLQPQMGKIGPEPGALPTSPEIEGIAEEIAAVANGDPL